MDTDINIYSADDLMWAIATRVDAKDDIQVVAPGGMGQTFQPAERSSAGDKQWTQNNIRFSGAIGMDATVPLIYRDDFERASYPVETVDVKDWFTEEQVAKAKSYQESYAKFFAESGI